jgi:hypothetical protein
MEGMERDGWCQGELHTLYVRKRLKGERSERWHSVGVVCLGCGAGALRQDDLARLHKQRRSPYALEGGIASSDLFVK